MKYAVASLLAFLIFSYCRAEQTAVPPLLKKAQYDSLSAGDKALLDSLYKKYPVPLHDTVRLALLVELSENCDEQDILFFASPANRLADHLLQEEYVRKDPVVKLNVQNKKAMALNNIGYLHWQQGNYQGALNFFNLGLKLREEIGDKKGLAESLNNLAELFRLRGNIFQALEYFNQSQKLREEINDKPGIIVSLNNISLIYLQQGAPDKALESYSRGLKLAEEIGDKLGQGLVLNNIAYVYQTLKDTARLIEYHTKALKIFREINYKPGIAIVLNNMGALYLYGNKDIPKALDHFYQSLKIWEENGDVVNYTLAFVNIGNALFNQGKYDQAFEYGNKALKTAQKSGYPESINRAALLLFNLYKVRGEYEKALTMHELYVQMRDSLFNEETRKSTLKQQMKYEYEKQEALASAAHQKELAITEEGKKRQTIASYSVGSGIVLLLLFSLVIFNRLQITRKQKMTIEEQKIIVDQKNKHITDSINYAKRIQDAVLPSRHDLEECFGDHFVFFQPREIVSGDFYWLSRQGDRVVLAVADCTGHGVPGASMSMIGNTLLNEIVNDLKILEPSQILDHLNASIIKALHQQSGEMADGMDIAICSFDKKSGKMLFAGANQSLYIVTGSGLNKISGDIFSIGGVFDKKANSFTQQEVSCDKDSTLFLCSDGFSDQRGGDHGKKFTSKRLEELFVSIANKPGEEQKQILSFTFNSWTGNYQQLDDVLVVGIKM